jgi:hypothetical protein
VSKRHAEGMSITKKQQKPARGGVRVATQLFQGIIHYLCISEHMPVVSVHGEER